MQVSVHQNSAPTLSPLVLCRHVPSSELPAWQQRLTGQNITLPGLVRLPSPHPQMDFHSPEGATSTGTLSDEDIKAVLSAVAADARLRQSFVRGLALFELAAVERGGDARAREIAALLERSLVERWAQVG